MGRTRNPLWVLIVIPLIILGPLLALWWFPGLVFLVTTRSYDAYCDGWAVVSGANIKLRQARDAAQIAKASRLVLQDGPLDLWQTPMGLWWIPRAATNDLLPDLLAWQQHGLYGKDDRGVRRGDIVLDCGAHVGTYTRAALAAGAKLVVAIEPSPNAVECLRRNFGSEIRAGSVIVYARGVWDREERLTLYDNGNAGAASSFVQHGESSGEIPAVPVTTIDNLTKELGLERVDFIKADIKGAAHRALLGATAVLRAYRPRLAISTEELGDDPQVIAAQIRDLGIAYTVRRGRCFNINPQHVQPDVLFFF